MKFVWVRATAPAQPLAQTKCVTVRHDILRFNLVTHSYRNWHLGYSNQESTDWYDLNCNEGSDMFTVTTLSSPAEQGKLKKPVGLLFIAFKSYEWKSCFCLCRTKWVKNLYTNFQCNVKFSQTRERRVPSIRFSSEPNSVTSTHCFDDAFCNLIMAWGHEPIDFWVVIP